MTMHLQKGLYNTNTKKRKQFRKPGWQKAQADHDLISELNLLLGKEVA